MAKELDIDQAAAVTKLKPGSILCGGVGSGKSRTALAFYYSKICGGGLETFEGEFTPPKKVVPLYVITTALKRDRGEWDKELLLYSLSCDKELSISGTPVVIDSWNNIKKYKDVKDAFFIFDEQKLSGYGAWVHIFLNIAKHNKWILLSATPGDNWLDYMPVFIANGYYKNKTDFVLRHVVYKPYRNYPVIDHYVNTRYLEHIRSEILVNIVYRPKAEHDVEVVEVGYDKDLYKLVMANRVDPKTKKPLKNISQFSYKLKEVVFGSQERVEACYRALQNVKRVIIFYNFNYEREALRALCDRLKIPYGERNGERHDDIPNTERWAYLVQYMSGAEGWNCIDTNYILFYSPSVSYKQMKQASGRIDRRNTSFNVLHYICLKSNAEIERRIYNTIKGKKKFNDSALSDLWDDAKKSTHIVGCKS